MGRAKPVDKQKNIDSSTAMLPFFPLGWAAWRCCMKTLRPKIRNCSACYCQHLIMRDSWVKLWVWLGIYTGCSHLRKQSNLPGLNKTNPQYRQLFGTGILNVFWGFVFGLFFCFVLFIGSFLIVCPFFPYPNCQTSDQPYISIMLLSVHWSEL